MKRLKYVGLALALVAIGFLVVGFFLPRNWRVSASVSIHAPPSAIYPYIHDFKKWEDWMLSRSQDPSYQVTYSDPSKGVGSWQRWTSNKSGSGQMWMTEADPERGIGYDSAIETTVRNGAGFVRLTPQGEETVVTWEDTGQLPPILGGYFRPMMERSLRDHLDKSLARLRGLLITEGDAAAAQ